MKIEAISPIRYRHSKWALNNRLFVAYLTTGPDVAGLLADLDGWASSAKGAKSSPTHARITHAGLSRPIKQT